MSVQPSVSVVVSVHDCTSTIKESIQHILSAGLDAEIIVVDDGSVDGGVAGYVRSLNNPAVMCFRNASPRGRGAAMRLGFAAARRPFIIVIAPDAALACDPSAYRMMLEPLVEGRADMVVEADDGTTKATSAYTGYPRIERIMARGAEAFGCIMRNAGANRIMAFRRDRLMALNLSSNGGAALASEIMTRAARGRWRIASVALPQPPGVTTPSESKPWRDALAGACALVYFRFMD
ncbi:MAG TPA: glycosyltransferase [Candidatus Binataceae bacterium]|nr:glycosyltransferase [Candidatus Binataceae bacterium]